jgi:hypothetical protein
MAINYNRPKIVTDGLVLCLDAGDVQSYGGSGSTWADRSGGGNGVTFNSTPSYDNNSYFSFSTSSHFANLPAAIGSIKGDITMEAWFDQGSRNGAHQTIICTNGSYRHGMKLMSAYHTLGGMFWVANGDGTDAYSLDTSGGTLENTGPNHLLATRNSTSGAIKIYLNGELSASATHITGDVYTPASNSGHIGKEYHSASYGLNAKVYATRVYNRTLTASEVLQNYNATKGRFGI